MCVIYVDIQVFYGLVNIDLKKQLIFQCIEDCKKSATQILIKNDKLDVNIKNNEGYTALIIVCCYNFPEILKILLTHKDIDVNVLTNNSYTGFLHSCFYGNTEIIELLLNRKDLNILNKSNNDKTGFSIACIRSHYNIVKLCESGLAQFCRAKLIIKSGRLNLNTLYLLIDDIFINICLNHDYEMLKILISIGYIIDKKIYKLYNDILKFSDEFIKSNEYFKLKY